MSKAGCCGLHLFLDFYFQGQTEWGNAIRKYFVNSRGVSLKVADHTPLFVSVNDPKESGLCLQARYKLRVIPPHTRTKKYS